MRGPKLNTLAQKLMAVRKIVLKKIKSTTAKSQKEFVMMTTERYKATHDGAPPPFTATRMFEGILQDVTWIKVTQDGEAKFIIEEGEEVREEEMVLDGATCTRVGQMEAKSRKVADQVALNLHATAVLEDPEEDDPEVEGDEDDDDLEHKSIGDSDSDDVMSLVKKSKPSKSVAQKGKSSTSKAAAKSAPVATAPKPPAITTPTKRRTPPAADDIGSSKRGRKSCDDPDDVDIDLYLNGEGYGELQKTLHATMKHIGDDKDLASTIDFSLAQHKACAKVLKPYCDELKKLHADIISVQWRIKKRKNYPPKAIDTLNVFRDLAQAAWLLMLQMALDPKFHDMEKINNYVKTMIGAQCQWPLRFKAISSALHEWNHHFANSRDQ
jgi:hypothetical protein